MKKNKVKIVSVLLIILSIISIGVNSNAHSGRTDANGGHRDNKNKSGLGSYHYHCGGHPAHLHTNGVCPYSTSSTSQSSTSSSSSSNSKTNINTKTTTTTPTTIGVTELKINENIESMEVGESKKLTVTIMPSNATDKNIIWKSSDESIATVSETGEVVAKKDGTVEITATGSNEKSSTIKIDIINALEEENNTITKLSTIGENNTTNNIKTSNNEESNPIGGIITLGLLGGGAYWGYKKYKKSK